MQISEEKTTNQHDRISRVRAGCCLRAVYVGKDGEDICAAFAAEQMDAVVEKFCDIREQTEIELNPFFVLGQFYFSDFLISGRAKCQVPKLFFEKRIRGGKISLLRFLSCCFF